MFSMTGYGRTMLERDGRQMTIEVKSVNHRFLDLSFRMPRSFGFLEEAARKLISERVSRGHLDLYVSYKNERSDHKTVEVDETLLAAYTKALKQVGEITGLVDRRSLMDMARLGDVLNITEQEEDQQVLREMFLEALNSALDELIEMRLREGQSLKEDALNRLSTLEALSEQIEARYPETVVEHRQKLSQRLDEILQDKGIALDEQRLAQEVAIMAEKSAIAEETVRLDSHIRQMREIVELDQAVGRKLDFIVQELNREVNTISSKSQDVPITQLAVDAKAEIEKIREQVQNIE